MSTCSQVCPVAKAMQLLDERWTLLVARELLKGSVTVHGATDARRAVPQWLVSRVWRRSPARLSGAHHP
jgi:DNA-binding HxlR family transcriptional regulator